MVFLDEDKEMIARLIRGFEHDLEELRHDQYGHSEIVSDLKESCREKIDWLESFQKRMEQEIEIPTHKTKEIPTWLYDRLNVLGIIPNDVRSFNVGASDYSKRLVQPWAIWIDYELNPWDADIVKRVLRHKETDSRKLDYQKIIHICQERIRQLDAEG